MIKHILKLVWAFFMGFILTGLIVMWLLIVIGNMIFDEAQAAECNDVETWEHGYLYLQKHDQGHCYWAWSEYPDHATGGGQAQSERDRMEEIIRYQENKQFQLDSMFMGVMQ